MAVGFHFELFYISISWVMVNGDVRRPLIIFIKIKSIDSYGVIWQTYHTSLFLYQ